MYEIAKEEIRESFRSSEEERRIFLALTNVILENKDRSTTTLKNISVDVNEIIKRRIKMKKADNRTDWKP